MKTKSVYFNSSDNIKLHLSLIYSRRKINKLLFIIHGSGGCTDKDYKYFGLHLAKYGVKSIIIDERGTGYSEGVKGDIENYEIILNDYLDIIQSYYKENLPIFICAHSFGCNIAVYLTMKLQKYISGVIFLNPMFKPNKKYTPSIITIIKFIMASLFYPNKPFYSFDNKADKYISTLDKKDLLEKNNNKRITKYFSIRWLLSSKKLIDNVENNIKSIKDIPLLLIRGLNDNFVDIIETERLFKLWDSNKKKYIININAGHGAYIADMAKDDIKDWLKEI